MSSWYFVKDGQRNGPIGREELDARIAEGAVDGDTLVWRVGMSAWLPAGTVPELGLPPPLPPPPLPPGQPPVYPAWSTGPESASGAGATMAGERAFEAPGRLVFAGFWARFAAKLLDGVVLYGIAMLVERAVAALWFNGVVPVPPDWEGVLRMVLYSGPINTVIAVVYTVYFMARHEATPGKRILGLRVVRADGGRVGTGRVIGRYFAESISTIVFLAGYVMAAFDDEKRALHDYMCDTRVVKGPREEEPEVSRQSDERWRDARRPGDGF